MPVTIRGLERSRLIPQEFPRRLEEFKRVVAGALAADFVEAEPRGGRWPKGRRRTIQEQTKAVIRGDVIIVGTFGSRYARALDRGNVTRLRRARALRFVNESGAFVFTTRPIRHAPRPFFEKAVSRAPAIIEYVWVRTMSKVGG